ncbi:MAG: sigma-70 family RNA polymerase sigma factor, partial [Oscillospiraceae bacterium]|nr:sigma-70 family RNA polymerase sigma factor [Oscillospiraceae bacterium]
AADLFQDTCLRAFKYYRNYDETKEFDKWIFSICVNTYRSGLRKLYRMKKLDFLSAEEHDDFFAGIPDTGNSASREEYKELIKAVKKLPEKFHIVIVLRFFSDFTEKDMAKMLGIPEGTVKSRISKAKKLLRKEMECDG